MWTIAWSIPRLAGLLLMITTAYRPPHNLRSSACVQISGMMQTRADAGTCSTVSQSQLIKLSARPPTSDMHASRRMQHESSTPVHRQTLFASLPPVPLHPPRFPTRFPRALSREQAGPKL